MKEIAITNVGNVQSIHVLSDDAFRSTALLDYLSLKMKAVFRNVGNHLPTTQPVDTLSGRRVEDAVGGTCLGATVNCVVESGGCCSMHRCSHRDGSLRFLGS